MIFVRKINFLISFKIFDMLKKSINPLSVIVAVVFLMTVVSCDPTEKREREEEEAIAGYLAGNPTLLFEQKASGLYYIELLPGSGPQAVKGDTAYVKYTGKFLDGTVFDTNVNKDDTLKFAVNEGYVLQGFDEGVTYMSQGSKAVFLLPSFLAYGTSGYFMPSYTPVIFDVELVKITPGVK